MLFSFRILSIIVLMLLLYAVSMLVFLRFNRGLAPTSRRQQGRRYLIASLLSGLALSLTHFSVWSPQVVAALVVSVAWMLVWNVTSDLTYRRSSPDYDNHIDIAFGPCGAPCPCGSAFGGCRGLGVRGRGECAAACSRDGGGLLPYL